MTRILLAVALCAGAAGCRSSPSEPRKGASGPVHAVPSSIVADCSKPVEAELNAFIAAVPNHSVIRFPASGCYAQANRIQVYDKTGVTIDGQGSTFRSSAANDGTKQNPNWLLLRGHDLTLRNLTAVGNFDIGLPRLLERVGQISANQFNAGVFIYGGDGVYVSDVRVRNVFGDGVGTAVSEYIADSGPPYESPRNVHIERVEATTTARHCFALTTVIGVWIEESIGRDCWYGGMDLELDDPERQKLQDVHILRNTFDGFYMFGIAIPVAGVGDNTRDIEIRENSFRTRADIPCPWIITVGAWPSHPHTFKNVVVRGNELRFVGGTAIGYDHVEGGSVRDNTLFNVPPPGSSDLHQGACSGPPVALTNSTGVSVAGNTVRTR